MPRPPAWWRSAAQTIVAAVLVVACTAGARAEIIDRVLAVVNGDLIMLSDVTAARVLGLANVEPGSELIRPVLSALIDRALELDEVDRYAPPEPTVEMVDEEQQKIRGRFGSQTDFERTLGELGLDVQHLRETVRENLRIRAYLVQRFGGDEARQRQLMNEWLTGLRRRAEIVDLSFTRP